MFTIWLVNTLRLKQNGPHFGDKIFKYVSIFIKILLVCSRGSILQDVTFEITLVFRYRYFSGKKFQDLSPSFQYFWVSEATPNSSRFQSILLSWHNIETFTISIGNHVTSRHNTLKLLGITLMKKMNFNEHIKNICQTSYRQINALRRISKCLNQRCREKICKSFINANFGYCPLVRMLCGKCNLRKIENITLTS